jgi:hypothetical protein
VAQWADRGLKSKTIGLRQKNLIFKTFDILNVLWRYFKIAHHFLNFAKALLLCICTVFALYGRARIRHQCRKIAVLSCHRFLINSGVEKMNYI